MYYIQSGGAQPKNLTHKQYNIFQFKFLTLIINASPYISKRPIFPLQILTSLNSIEISKLQYS